MAIVWASEGSFTSFIRCVVAWGNGPVMVNWNKSSVPLLSLHSPNQKLLLVALLDSTVKVFFSDTLKVIVGQPS